MMNSLNNRCLSGYGCNNSFALYHIHAVLGSENQGDYSVFFISAPGVQIYITD
jgi:hypothetical protein